MFSKTHQPARELKKEYFLRCTRRKRVRMHDFHLVTSVIKSIEEKTSKLENIKRVTLIRLTIGSLKMVTKEHFTQTFKEISRGTICEGARLAISEVSGDVLVVENIEGEFD